MDIEKILEESTPHIIRSVSKTGEFDFAQEYIEKLIGQLSEQQVISLYEKIRDESSRLEDEWRDDFIGFFPEYEDSLPEEEC